MKKVLSLSRSNRNFDSRIIEVSKSIFVSLSTLKTNISNTNLGRIVNLNKGISALVMSIFLLLGNSTIAQVQMEKASNHSVLTRQLNLVMEKAMHLKGGNIVNKMDQENSLKDLEINLNDASKQMAVISDMTPNFKKENESMKKHLTKAKDHLKELKTEIEKAIPDQSKIMSHAGEVYNEIEKAQEDHKELKMKAEK
jgi:chromosome segregation ATPase